jgi:hypothetical protein
LPDGFFFKPKIPIWENFGGPLMGKCWYILCPFGIFYNHLEYFTNIWNILQTFGIFYKHLEYFTNIWNILQTFGIFYKYLGYVITISYLLLSVDTFFRFWYHEPRKIWQPCSHLHSSKTQQ